MMPAKDRYHDVVIRALVKAGWRVIAEQAAVLIGGRRLWIDIEAAKGSDSLSILVEVKGFENMPSPVNYLAEAVGKYVLYRAALNYGKVTTPLYMAVPTMAYTGILDEDLGQQAIIAGSISLIVFDPIKEEIIQWIP